MGIPVWAGTIMPDCAYPSGNWRNSSSLKNVDLKLELLKFSIFHGKDNTLFLTFIGHSGAYNSETPCPVLLAGDVCVNLFYLSM